MKKFIYAVICFSVMLYMGVIGTSAIDAESVAGVVATAENNLNVRRSPDAKSEILTKLKKGSYVTVEDKNGDWYNVEYAPGKYGYCHSDYIKTVDSSLWRVAVSSGNLNVRQGAGKAHPVIGALAKGEKVLVLDSVSGWKKILYHGTKTGYVSSGYLSAETYLYPEVKLSVPSFKQTDSRWADVKIGSSGKTIAQIGCATTAIAMMESYRTGSVIYPDVMSKKLSYSSSGSVYWPAHYKVDMSSSGYLSKIYNLLRQGKPVLLGAKNSYGTQHWVVITGYKGSASSLTANDFIINDPGSNSRTTLQSFLSAYPVFYKYFSY